MILISHRGNIDGKKPHLENSPSYIDEAIELGYDVEVDLWFVDGKFMLGHDEPQYEIDFKWLEDRSDRLWVHCKDIPSVEYFTENAIKCAEINWFWHENDTMTLTSFGYVWVYPGRQPILRSIAVMPEREGDDISSCLGICSDVIKKYKDEITQA
jgi:hypothetical protein